MEKKKNITILAIETSCDDTGIAIIKAPLKTRGAFNVLSNIISSQIQIHAKYGGVYPMMAKREHQKNLVFVLEKALRGARLIKRRAGKKETVSTDTLKEILSREDDLCKTLSAFFAKYEKPDIDAIAVTNGPGLEPCLWVGVNFAKALSYTWNIPLIPVNHIKAHIFVNMLEGKKLRELKTKDFPALCLIVSGGHTQLFLMKDLNKYQVLGETRDDAAGECFDKTARIIGLGYPGGPILSRQAEGAKNRFNIQLPRPMINTKDYDFSFSGLKTAVLYDYLREKPRVKRNKEYIKEMAFQIQQSVIDVLIKKTSRATRDYKIKTLMIGGGVAANKELRKQMKKEINKAMPKVRILIPDQKYCTDNGLMTAIAGYFEARRGKKRSWRKIGVKANLTLQ